MATNGVIKTFSEYQRLSQDNKDLYMFERISMIPDIKQDIIKLKTWKIKVVGVATGVSAVIGFIGGKITSLFQ